MEMRTFGHPANAERAVCEVLSLPIEPRQSPDDTLAVAHWVRAFFAGR